MLRLALSLDFLSVVDVGNKALVGLVARVVVAFDVNVALVVARDVVDPMELGLD